MKIYVICSVRGMDESYRKMLERHVQDLEDERHQVHLPHRDTNQNGRGIDICKQNMEATIWADEIHVFYNSKSQGTHFDLGMAFILNKKIVIIDNEKYGPGKSFARLLDEWEEQYHVDEQKYNDQVNYDKAILECYKRLFAVSEPPADFEKLLADTKKPCGFELTSNVNFMAYTIDEKICDQIIEDILKEFKIPKYIKSSFRTEILLGLSPKFKQK